MANHPDHYTSHPSGVECIDIVEHMGFNLGNVIKYTWRGDAKTELVGTSAVEDLQKAAWYLQREIERRAETRAADPPPVSGQRCPTCDADPTRLMPGIPVGLDARVRLRALRRDIKSIQIHDGDVSKMPKICGDGWRWAIDAAIELVDQALRAAGDMETILSHSAARS